MFGRKLISDILDKFLKNAVPHLIGPQRDELSSLAPAQLRKILEINKLPLKKSELEKLSTDIPRNLLLRLIKRVNIHNAIVEAEKKDIYEIEEEKTLNLLKKRIIPAIKHVQVQGKTQLKILRVDIDKIVENSERDVAAIEKVLDQLLDIMQLGLGEKDFWRLLNYYEQISLEKAQAYKRFYEMDFGEEDIRVKLIDLQEIKLQKINFIYNSNLIEGIDIPLENYTETTEERLIKGHGEAFDYMLSHYTEIPGQKHIKAMHRLLTEGVLKEEQAGHYRTRNVYITARRANGEQVVIAEGAPPVEVRAKMVALVKRMRSARTEVSIWNIHNEFEIIHPFADGNGRIGRLLLNWLRLRNGYPLLTIDIEERRSYYQRIAEYRKHKRLLFEEQLF